MTQPPHAQGESSGMTPAAVFAQWARVHAAQFPDSLPGATSKSQAPLPEDQLRKAFRRLSAWVSTVEGELGRAIEAAPPGTSAPQALAAAAEALRAIHASTRQIISMTDSIAHATPPKAQAVRRPRAPRTSPVHDSGPPTPPPMTPQPATPAPDPNGLSLTPGLANQAVPVHQSGAGDDLRGRVEDWRQRVRQERAARAAQAAEERRAYLANLRRSIQSTLGTTPGPAAQPLPPSPTAPPPPRFSGANGSVFRRTDVPTDQSPGPAGDHDANPKGLSAGPGRSPVGGIRFRQTGG